MMDIHDEVISVTWGGLIAAAGIQIGFMVAHYEWENWQGAKAVAGMIMEVRRYANHSRERTEEIESLKADNTRLRNLLGEWNDE